MYVAADFMSSLINMQKITAFLTLPSSIWHLQSYQLRAFFFFGKGCWALLTVTSALEMGN